MSSPVQQQGLHLPVPEANSLSAFLSGARRQQQGEGKEGSEPEFGV